MTWLVWRQHRKQLLFGVLALIALGAFFVGTGRPIHDRFEKLGLPECLPAAMDAPVVVDTDALDRSGIDDPAVDEATLAVGRCVQSARDFYGDYQNVLLVGTLLWVLPMLAGMFWGHPSSPASSNTEPTALHGHRASRGFAGRQPRSGSSPSPYSS